ncbi:PepSY domain-containing protein [Methylotenera sp. L2L1]|uniref:PepSY domain-containing protein n=1 Tax=Methylotenera sp. L2L1 TaxID=1502770 RepID=UPI000565C84B|nr:PepSY domain-containing protein [Methylotenera sp. L2L1]
MMTKKLNISVLLILACLLLASLLIVNDNHAKADSSQQTARQLLSAGKILPLEKITKLAKEIKPGEVLETELEQKKGLLIYEVEILDAQSQVWEIKLDAKTGKLIKLELED